MQCILTKHTDLLELGLRGPRILTGGLIICRQPLRKLGGDQLPRDMCMLKYASHVHVCGSNAPTQDRRSSPQDAQVPEVRPHHASRVQVRATQHQRITPLYTYIEWMIPTFTLSVGMDLLLTVSAGGHLSSGQGCHIGGPLMPAATISAHRRESTGS